MFREGSTSLRIEPLEAALSQILAPSWSEVKSHQREEAGGSIGSHGNTRAPIFKLVG
jgi:hypothetical protein